MANRNMLLLTCQLGRSPLADECVCHLSLPGGDYIGAVPREYCFTRAGRRLHADQPFSGKVLAGLVSAILVRMEEGRGVRVSLPDGAVEVVPTNQVRLARPRA